MPGIIVDGFDFFAVHEAASERSPGREGAADAHRDEVHSLIRPFRGRPADYRASEVEHARANSTCLKRFAGRVTRPAS